MQHCVTHHKAESVTSPADGCRLPLEPSAPAPPATVAAGSSTGPARLEPPSTPTDVDPVGRLLRATAGRLTAAAAAASHGELTGPDLLTAAVGSARGAPVVATAAISSVLVVLGLGYPPDVLLGRLLVLLPAADAAWDLVRALEPAVEGILVPAGLLAAGRLVEKP